MFGYCLTGVCFITLGLFMFLKPDIIWKLTEQWKSYYADEPSDLYLISTKLGGAAFGILGIVVIVLPFILE